MSQIERLVSSDIAYSVMTFSKSELFDPRRMEQINHWSDITVLVNSAHDTVFFAMVENRDVTLCFLIRWLLRNVRTVTFATQCRRMCVPN